MIGWSELRDALAAQVICHVKFECIADMHLQL